MTYKSHKTSKAYKAHKAHKPYPQKTYTTMKLLFLTTLLIAATTAKAQFTDQAKALLQAQNALEQNTEKSVDKNILNHLDFSLTAGTTGIGFDLAMPIGEYVQVRTGGTFMPHFKYNMDFLVMVGDDGKKISEARFNNIATRLEALTGFKVDNVVRTIGEPSFNNFKLLVDVFPFRNKHWHITAGFYLGGSTLGNAYNATEEMQTLLGVNIYNYIYNSAVAAHESFGSMSDYLMPGYSPQGVNFFEEKFLEYGQMSIPNGYYTHDVYATEDILYDHDVYDVNETSATYGTLLHSKGDVKVAKGEVLHKAGDKYRMMPDGEGMVKAKAKINRFKPYIGFGYGGPISKDKKTSISFDAGLMFWGGAPDIIMHDGIDLINDVERLEGQLGDYVDKIKMFKVFPVISLRLTQRLF